MSILYVHNWMKDNSMPHRWKPIDDLPEDFSALTDSELVSLLVYWQDQRADLEQEGALGVFNTSLSREWAIETGQIEGVYDLDRGITRTLIERGIEADLIGHQPGQKPPELIAAILRDHQEALEGLFQFVKGERPLSKSYIHELHSALLRHQDTTIAVDQFGRVFETEVLKGQYKTRPNNPTREDGSVHEYCPPEHVDAEMERLIQLHEEHGKAGVPVEVEAAWLHHRFVQIHPFQDGNGRVARALASLVFLRAGWFPVVVTRDDRSRYIDALEVADNSELRPLIGVFVDIQKRALFQAIKIAAEVQPPAETVEAAIAAAKQLLGGRGRSLEPTVWRSARNSSERLFRIGKERLDKTSSMLRDQIGPDRPEWTFRDREPSPCLNAVALGYEPNPREFDRNVSIQIDAEHTSHIWLNAHAIGSKFRGLIGFAVLFLAEGEAQQLASETPFQVNYAEPYESVERRFRVWLERSLARALTLWRQSL
jgi:fido (protein-threonine AMPylation protein)